MKKFLLVLAIFVLALCAIATSACVWNTASEGNADGFYVVTSLIYLAAAGYFGYEFFKGRLNKPE